MHCNMRMRKKPRGKERLSVLSALTVSVPADGGRVSFNFEKELPLRLEIGCGKGDFIRGLSRQEPDYNYLAMERCADVAVIAMEKYAADRRLGRPYPQGGWEAPDGTVYKDTPWDIPLDMRGNVRFMPMEAGGLTDYFEGGIFESIYANFSDPWPKKGHARRRLTHPDFLERYLYLLRPGGYFRFKTDNAGLFAYSLEMLENSPFTITFVTHDLHSSERADNNIMTEYERNFTAKGFPIHMVEARNDEQPAHTL